MSLPVAGMVGFYLGLAALVTQVEMIHPRIGSDINIWIIRNLFVIHDFFSCAQPIQEFLHVLTTIKFRKVNFEACSQAMPIRFDEMFIPSSPQPSSTRLSLLKGLNRFFFEPLSSSEGQSDMLPCPDLSPGMDPPSLPWRQVVSLC